MPSSRRVLKVAEAIREVVSMAILTELRDPRIRNVTVTFVEASADLRHSKIHVSIMGDDKQQQLSLHGLESAAGFLQSKVASRLDLRYTPRLAFVLDQGVKKSIEVSRILAEVLPREPNELAENTESADEQDQSPEVEPPAAEQPGGEEPPH